MGSIAKARGDHRIVEVAGPVDEPLTATTWVGCDLEYRAIDWSGEAQTRMLLWSHDRCGEGVSNG